MTFLVVIAFCGLGWRLIDLQYLTADESWNEFAKRSMVEEAIVPWRGDITDRHGSALATSVRHYDIGADPSFNGPFHKEVAAAVAPILGMSFEELERKIRPRTYVTENGETNEVKYVSVAKAVPHEQLVQISSALKLIGKDWDQSRLAKTNRQHLSNVRKKGVYESRQVQKRQYPNGKMLGPVLGLVNGRDYTPKDATSPSYYLQFGANGIEAALNSQLTGTQGRIRKERTELVDRITDQISARDGLNAALTIDRRIQEVLDQVLSRALGELGAKSVFGIVMDVNTFEILAVSDAPTFDPRDRGTYKEEYAKILSFTEVFEPGSIIKAIPIAGALERRVVSLETPIFCENGLWTEPARPLEDSHPYGLISVEEIVTKSSNIGTAKIVQLMGNSVFYDFMLKFGIGSKTGVGLYEEKGLLYPINTYRPVDFTRLPIGYASAVTQLQMACIYSAIANGGKMMRPQILSRIEGRDGMVAFQFSPQMVEQVISQRASRDIMKALRTVTEPGGTATKAALDYYTVAGKTGTAHRYRNGPDAGYDNKHYNGSFVGVFPATDPRICIAITVVEPNVVKAGYYGGKVAAPLFAEVASVTGQYLNIRPDKTPEPTDAHQSTP